MLNSKIILIISVILLSNCSFNENNDKNKKCESFLYHGESDKKVYYYSSSDSLDSDIYKVTYDTVVNSFKYIIISDYKVIDDSIIPFSISKYKIVDAGFYLEDYGFIAKDSFERYYFIVGKILGKNINTFDSSSNNNLVTNMEVSGYDNIIDYYSSNSYRKSIETTKDFVFNTENYKTIKVVDSCNLVFPNKKIYFSYIAEKYYSKGIGLVKSVQIMPKKTNILTLKEIISYEEFRKMNFKNININGKTSLFLSFKTQDD